MIFKPCNECGARVAISQNLSRLKGLNVFCSKKCNEDYFIKTGRDYTSPSFTQGVPITRIGSTITISSSAEDYLTQYYEDRRRGR